MHLIGLDYIYNCRIWALQSLALLMLFGTNRWHQVTREEKWLFVHMSTLAVVSWCRVDNRVSVCEALRKYWLPWAPALLSPFPNTSMHQPHTPEPGDISSMPPGQWLVVCPAHFHQRWLFPHICLAPSEMSLITSSRCQQSLWNKWPCLIFGLNIIKLVTKQIN